MPVPPADDGDDFIAGLLQRFRRRKGNRRTDATANHDAGAKFLDLRVFAQGTDDIRNGVAGFESIQHLGCLADALDNDRHRPSLRVGIGNRQGDAFAGLRHAHDDKLAGFLPFGDARRDKAQQFHVRREEARLSNFKAFGQPVSS